MGAIAALDRARASLWPLWPLDRAVATYAVVVQAAQPAPRVNMTGAIAALDRTRGALWQGGPDRCVKRPPLSQPGVMPGAKAARLMGPIAALDRTAAGGGMDGEPGFEGRAVAATKAGRARLFEAPLDRTESHGKT